MAASTSTTTDSVYLHVIEDVLTKVRHEFVANGGPGEEVLGELQGIWESKMKQAGVIRGRAERSAVAKTATPGAAATPVHDLNVPYEGEEYETPTADMLFPPTPMPTPMPTPLPGSADNSGHNIPTEPSGYPTPGQDALRNSGADFVVKPGTPNSYMQSSSPWMNQRPSLGDDVNLAYSERREDRENGTSNQSLTQDFLMITSGKRKRDNLVPQYQNGMYIPQQDSAGDIHESLQVKRRSNLLPAAEKEHRQMLVRSTSRIPQVDGQLPDPYDDLLLTPNIYNYQVVSEDYNIASTPAPNDLQAATPAPYLNNDLADDDDEEEPPLNENDDDDNLDDADEGDELNTQHLVLAQFDKVTRTKSRWRCILKDGIMHVKDRDLLFNKAMGEFDF